MLNSNFFSALDEEMNEIKQTQNGNLLEIQSKICREEKIVVVHIIVISCSVVRVCCFLLLTVFVVHVCRMLV